MVKEETRYPTLQETVLQTYDVVVEGLPDSSPLSFLFLSLENREDTPRTDSTVKSSVLLLLSLHFPLRVSCPLSRESWCLVVILSW